MTKIGLLTKSLDNLTLDSLDDFVNSFEKLTIDQDSSLSFYLNEMTFGKDEEVKKEKDIFDFVDKFKSLKIDSNVVEKLDDKLIDSFRNMSVMPKNRHMDFMLCLYEIIRTRQQRRCGTMLLQSSNRHVNCH